MLLDKGKVRVWSGIALLTLSSMSGYINLLFPLLPLMFVNYRLFCWSVDLAMWTWFQVAIFIMKYVWSIRFFIGGDNFYESLKHKSVLMIMNHRSELDWFYLYAYLGNRGLLNIRNVLKNSFKYLPPFGWCMQFPNYIFLQRKWATDEQNLCDRLKIYSCSQRNVWVLIFPEGTNLSEEHKLKSNDYAEKNGLVRTQYTLHPRITGFACLKQNIENCKNYDNHIINMTIGYRGDYPQELSEFITNGKLPSEVHLSVDLNSPIIDSTKDCECYLRECWDKKENVLSKFYGGELELSSEELKSNSLLLMAISIFIQISSIIATLYGL